MKKLWLSAITAACLLAGNAAQAGDHGRHGDDWDHGHREYRHCDNDRGYRGDWHGGWYRRPVMYAPPVVYSRPVYYARPVYYERPAYYEERPAYYGTAYGGSDGEIHGTISVGF